MTSKEFDMEVNSLDGNISRICVTDSIRDCVNNYELAKERLRRIYEYRMNVLEKSEKV